jgi:hypothetical protein
MAGMLSTMELCPRPSALKFWSPVSTECILLSLHPKLKYHKLNHRMLGTVCTNEKHHMFAYKIIIWEPKHQEPIAICGCFKILGDFPSVMAHRVDAWEMLTELIQWYNLYQSALATGMLNNKQLPKPRFTLSTSISHSHIFKDCLGLYCTGLSWLGMLLSWVSSRSNVLYQGATWVFSSSDTAGSAWSSKQKFTIALLAWHFCSVPLVKPSQVSKPSINDVPKVGKV